MIRVVAVAALLAVGGWALYHLAWANGFAAAVQPAQEAGPPTDPLPFGRLNLMPAPAAFAFRALLFVVALVELTRSLRMLAWPFARRTWPSVPPMGVHGHWHPGSRRAWHSQAASWRHPMWCAQEPPEGETEHPEEPQA